MQPKEPPAGSPADEPFAEQDVEEMLIAWLKQKGYRVRQRIPYSDEIVDIVASGPRGDWIIEVAGENHDGYAAALASFQLGLGQLVSRMTDARGRYALAIPATENFDRVLHKCAASHGLSRLELAIITVDRNGGIRAFRSASLATILGVGEAQV